MAEKKNIVSEFNKYDLPDEVKTKANDIYNKMYKISTKRGKCRHQMLYILVYNAYKELGTPLDPIVLAKAMGLEKSQINKAFTKFSEIQTGYKSINIEIDIVSIIKRICENIGFDEDRLQHCLQVADIILEKDKDLLGEYRIQKIAAAIIEYYLYISGHQVDKELFSNITGISSSSINFLHKRMSNAYNS